MRVGTSSGFSIALISVKDHPHACGDKLIMLNGSMAKLGSSPCVWGQERRACGIPPVARIIPMRVGTRYMRIKNYIICKDHPHACGDKLICTFSMSRLIGSSPCVWGQVNNHLSQATVDRIIPMRVGTR